MPSGHCRPVQKDNEIQSNGRHLDDLSTCTAVVMAGEWRVRLDSVAPHSSLSLQCRGHRTLIKDRWLPGTTPVHVRSIKINLERSGGVPRAINSLCFNALLVARAAKRDRADGGEEFKGHGPHGRVLRRRSAAALSGVSHAQGGIGLGGYLPPMSNGLKQLAEAFG